MLGRPVAHELQAQGIGVRVLSRQPERARTVLGDGFDIRTGDATVGDTLSVALEGCSGVHINLRATRMDQALEIEADGAARIAGAARAAGVERLTYLSGAGIEIADPRLLPARVKQTAEAAIRESGVPYTILRATHFMESLDAFVRGKAATVPGPQPHRYHYLAASDYARQVAAAYRNPAAVGRALTLLGPEAFTMKEALARYRAILRPDISVRGVPLPVLQIAGRLTGNAQIRMVATLFDAFRKIPESGDAAAADALVGPATTRLDDWLSARKAGDGEGLHLHSKKQWDYSNDNWRAG